MENDTENLKKCAENDLESEFLEECYLDDWKDDYGTVDEEYRFQEEDDPRTWDGSLVPDFSKEITEADYYQVLLQLIDAGGKVAYFFKMKKNFVRDANHGKDVALIYGHDLEYYKRRLSWWKSQARKELALYKMVANKFGIGLARNDKEILNSLVEADRRAKYKDYVKGAKKRNEILGLEDLERKYQELIEKRSLKSAF